MSTKNPFKGSFQNITGQKIEKTTLQSELNLSAQKTTISPQTLLNRLSQHPLFTENKENLFKENTFISQNLIEIDRLNDLLIICLPSKKNLQVINLKKLKEDDKEYETKYQVTFIFHLIVIFKKTIETSPIINFDIQRLIFNNTFKFLCLIGDNSCMIVDFSQRSISDLNKGLNTICK